MRGERTDTPHRTAYDLAELLLAPWPSTLPEPGWPEHWRAKTVHTGAFSRFDGRSPAPVGERPGRARPRRVLLFMGSGGRDVSTAEVAAAQAAAPDWRWTALGGPDGRWEADPWPALCAADVVVTHAGQNALAECAAARRPAVVVPQDRPFGEQAATGRALARGRLAVVAPRWPDADDWAPFSSRLTPTAESAGRGGRPGTAPRAPRAPWPTPPTGERPRDAYSGDHSGGRAAPAPGHAAPRPRGRHASPGPVRGRRHGRPGARRGGGRPETRRDGRRLPGAERDPAAGPRPEPRRRPRGGRRRRTAGLPGRRLRPRRAPAGTLPAGRPRPRAPALPALRHRVLPAAPGPYGYRPADLPGLAEPHPGRPAPAPGSCAGARTTGCSGPCPSP